MSLSYNGGTSLTVNFGSGNKNQTDAKAVVILSTNEPSEACENVPVSGSFNYSLSGLSSNTGYDVSAVFCYSPPGNCSAPIVKEVKTLPAREYLADVLFAPN